MTLHEQAARARDRLIQAGISRDEAALDARVLAQAVLGWTGARFVTAIGESGPPDFEPRFDALVARRERREPTAYITGEREFWGLDFEVSPAVLIPRPETELVVETSLELVADRTSAHRIADVGTGSGCLAVALAGEFRGARIVATDISAAALEVAWRNARRHGVAERVEFFETDLLEPGGDPFRLIVSNPPYVAERDRQTLQREVLWEPEAALFAGDDGLTVIRRLLIEAAPRLTAGGLLILECGLGQADEVGGLISATGGLTMIGFRPDLQGIPRVAIARRMR